MKKAFTLIEMLAILLILAILSLILIPTVQEGVKKAKDDTYNAQVTVILNAAENYFMNSNYVVKKKKKKVIYLSDIVNSGYLDSKKIVSPVDESEMTGCVLISTYSNQYHYKYLSTLDKCQEYSNIIE